MQKCKRLLALLLVYSMIFSVSFVSTPEVSAAKVKLNKTKLTLQVKKTYKLKVKGTKKKPKWSSSKKKVATVSSKGVVKGKKIGSAVITAKVGKKKYKCKVKVVKAIADEDEVVIGGNPTTTQKSTSTTQSGNSNSSENTTASAGESGGSDVTTQAGGSESGSDSTTASKPTEATTTTEKLDDKYYEEYEPGDFSGEDFDDKVPKEEELDETAKKVETSEEKTLKHIVITVENKNTVWLDSATVYYKYVDDKGNVIATGTEYLGAMKPGEVQYISVEVEESDLALINFSKSTVVIDTVPAITEDYEYEDKSDEQNIVSGEPDEYDPYTVNFSIKNHSGEDVEGNYVIHIIYNDPVSGPREVDTITGEYSATMKDTMEDAFVYPNYVLDVDGKTRIEITPDMVSRFTYTIDVIAHSMEEITEEKTLGKAISVEAQKLASCVVLKLTNNGTINLCDIEAEAMFYDDDDEYVTEDAGTLSVLQANKSLGTQYIVIPLGDEELQEINIDNSVFNIIASENNGEYSYADTDKVHYTITEDEDYPNDYSITIYSESSLNTAGSFIVFFYDEHNNPVDAYQDLFELDGKVDEENPFETYYVSGPTKEDGAGNLVKAYTGNPRAFVYANVVNTVEE